MKTSVFSLLLFLSYFNVCGQNYYENMPYIVPDKEISNKLLHSYILHDNEDELCILKLYQASIFELLIYPKNKDVIASYQKGVFFGSRKKRAFLSVSKTIQILQKDTLSFAILSEDNNINQFSFFYDGKNFYKNKLDLFLHRKPVYTPVNIPDLTNDWTIHPITQNDLITKSCRKSDNLDCLCSALTYEMKSDKEKSDAIASFIIEHFRYNRGDTSQTNIKGLVFGKEKEAVCEGYSRVYFDLMSRVGVNSKYVSGSVRTDVESLFYSGHSHAWNQVELDGVKYTLDVTWARNINSQWYLLSPEDMVISHFEDHNSIIPYNQFDSTLTMYDFMHLPYVQPIEKGGYKNLHYLDKIEPMQFAEGTFVLNFSKSFQVSSVTRNELSYPFVRFESENNIVATKIISKAGKISNKISSKNITINLPEQINYLTVDIHGIGTVHYVVFNGTEKEYYQYLIDNFEPENVHSIAIAFLACAKLKDPAVFKTLSAYLDYPMNYKAFIKQAEKMKIDDFKYCVYNAGQHISYSSAKDYNFVGYKFEFSRLQNGRSGKIFIQKKDDGTYRFRGFGESSFEM